jgi:hypothetical protein
MTKASNGLPIRFLSTNNNKPITKVKTATNNRLSSNSDKTVNNTIVYTKKGHDDYTTIDIIIIVSLSEYMTIMHPSNCNTTYHKG